MLAKPPALTGYLGKKISEICSRSIVTDPKANHCAHFVSHVMEYDSFPNTCKNQSTADKLLPGKGAAIRVNEIFDVADTGPWSSRPLALTSCLIFVTHSGNLKKSGGMKDSPYKHIGIVVDGVVWHCGFNHVVAKNSIKPFITMFSLAHGYVQAGQTVEFFYGRFLK